MSTTSTSTSGHLGVLEISIDTGTTWNILASTEYGIDFSSNILDVTDASNTDTGYMTKLHNLRDWSVSASLNYSSDNVALINARNAFYATLQTTVLIRARVDRNATTGWSGTAFISSFNLSVSTDSQITASMEFMGSGAPTLIA